jgi:tetratricopeptide (TPR) repeat protein
MSGPRLLGRHVSDIAIANISIRVLSLARIPYDARWRSAAPGRLPALAPRICARAAVALLDWVQAWSDRASKGRKRSKPSLEDSAERPRSGAEGKEAARPVAITRDDEQYDEVVAALREAVARGDANETVQLAALLRDRFPGRADGYRIAAKALRQSKRFDEVDVLLLDAKTRFPDDAWPLAECATTALERGDREAAIEGAGQLRARFPASQAGYRIAAVALRDSKRLDETDALLREAMTRFPDEDWPLVESVWAAYGSGVRDAAILRAQHLRARFPANQAGYRVAAVALREGKRFDEVDELLSEAMTRFPDEAWPLEESAWAANVGGNWEEGARRAELLRTRFPTRPAGYRVGIHALRRANRPDEADAVLREAEIRFPGTAWTSAAS